MRDGAEYLDTIAQSFERSPDFLTYLAAFRFHSAHLSDGKDRLDHYRAAHQENEKALALDPGFGHASAGGAGARGVLEVRCHEAPFVLEHGQSVGRLVYEKMAARPAMLYGAALKSNYQGQGLKLSKHFRAP